MPMTAALSVQRMGCPFSRDAIRDNADGVDALQMLWVGITAMCPRQPVIAGRKRHGDDDQ
jgi:hypothetical protein